VERLLLRRRKWLVLGRHRRHHGLDDACRELHLHHRHPGYRNRDCWVNADFNIGDSEVAAFPNSLPIITIRGDFRYNFFSSVTTIPVGQEGDLFFSATDPDGDNVRYDLSTACGGASVDASFFSAVSFTTTTSPGVTPPGAFNTSWNPTFRGYTNPNQDCVLTLVVHDLCTAGNCGAPGSQGSLPDGADKVSVVAGTSVTSSTTGIINATHPSQARRAPHILRVIVPNQLGADAGNQTWDPKKVVVVEPSTTYTLKAEADDRFESGNLSVVWACSTGSASTPTNTGNLESVATWTSPATLAVGMTCTATFTSDTSGLSTVVTIEFAGAGTACFEQPDGTACDDGNACTTGETCQSGACSGGTATVCTALDQCHNAGVCDTLTGTCSNPAKPDGEVCNADSSLCTAVDTCQAGACVAGAPVACTALDACHVAGVCDPQSGTCSNPPAASGVSCDDGSLCTQTDQCDGLGACVGSNPVVCAAAQCSSGGTCNPANGVCEGGTNLPSSTSCNDGLGCTTSDHCDGLGQCVGGSPLCSAPNVCQEPGTCVPPAPLQAQVAQYEGWALGNVFGLAYDLAGYVYQAGNNFQPGWDFGTGTLNSNGASDAFVVKLDPATGRATAGTWAKDFGDVLQDQSVQGLAVSASQVGFIGNFKGTLDVTGGGSCGPACSVTNPGELIDFVAGLNAENGQGLWIKALNLNNSTDTVAGRLMGIASNPTQTHFALCGYVVDKVAPATIVNDPAAVAGGGRDLVIAILNAADGSLVWGKQIGGAGDQTCEDVAFDDAGDVFVTGYYNAGALQFGATPLTSPTGSSFFMFVAKLNGATGSAMASASFGAPTASRIYPRTMAVDGSGNVGVAGQFQATAAFGATTLVASGTTLDAFMVKLDASFAPVFAGRLGGTGNDEARACSFDSSGQMYVAGIFSGTTTSGTGSVAALTSAGSNDAFLFRFASDGALTFSSAFGDAYSQESSTLVATRLASGAERDSIWMTGNFDNSITFPPLSALPGAPTETRKFVVKMK
jgi:hypothetical protein